MAGKAQLARARILLKTAEGWAAAKVAETLDLSVGTVFRTKRRLAQEGLEGALRERPRPRRRRKLEDSVIVTAILDRLLHHSHVLNIHGKTYRFREKRRADLFGPVRQRVETTQPLQLLKGQTPGRVNPEPAIVG